MVSSCWYYYQLSVFDWLPLSLPTMLSLSFPLDVGDKLWKLVCMFVGKNFHQIFFFFKEIPGPRKAAELSRRPLAEGKGGAALVPSPMSLLLAWD